MLLSSEWSALQKVVCRRGLCTFNGASPSLAISLTLAEHGRVLKAVYKGHAGIVSSFIYTGHLQILQINTRKMTGIGTYGPPSINANKNIKLIQHLKCSLCCLI